MIDTITSEERMKSLGYGRIKPRSPWPAALRVVGQAAILAVMAVVTYLSLVIGLAL